MKRLFGKANSEKGMVTIEATIALTTFLFAFMMIYSIVTICRAQAKIQVALNNTAQEISQYSYIYGMTGLDESLANFQTEAGNTKTEVNGLVKNTIGVFEGIQSIGDKAGSVDIGNVDSMLNSWDSISQDLKSTKDDFTSVKTQIEEMAKNPQKLLFGMAKLLGSEALEVAKSRVIAEPVTRALIQKHLKRFEGDSADAYCKSVGIVPGTYLMKKSYFNGIDFSHSTLFPCGSAEITLIANYKVKLLQLLPIDIEFSITQSASTKGWLHGDKTTNSAADLVEDLKTDKDVASSVWNSQSVNDRNKTVRTLELEILKKAGYDSVSGETYIQAYDDGSNTFAMIAMCNPIYGVDGVDQIDKKSVEENIKRLAAQMNSATDNRQTVKIKVKDDKGNMTTKVIDCTKQPINKKIVLIVPEDTGVKDYVQKIIDESGYSGMFSVEAKYGTGYKLPEKTQNSDTSTEGGNS